MSATEPCEDCPSRTGDYAEITAITHLQEDRIRALEDVVKEVPRMQARIHMLMYIMIASMTILISISGFSFLQLVDFKKVYFQDRHEHTEQHSVQQLQQEQRYIDLINKLGERVSILEARNLFKTGVIK